MAIDSGRDHRDRGARRGAVHHRQLSAGQYQDSVAALGLDNIRGADEFGDEAAYRSEVDVTRRTDLRDGAFAHDDNAVAERHCFGLVMGDVNRGDAQHAQQTVELAAQSFAQRRVERGQRLVEQQHARAHRHSTRQSHALALPAGKLVNAAMLQAFDASERHQFGNPRLCARPWAAA